MSNTSITDRLDSEITAAQRQRSIDKRETQAPVDELGMTSEQRLGALRLIRDALQKELKAANGKEIDELAVLRRERKRRIQAADEYAKGTGLSGEAGERSAASERIERAEAALIDTYLPQQLSEDAVSELVTAAITSTGASGKADTGRVIGAVMKQAAGQADGKLVSRLVAAALS